MQKMTKQCVFACEHRTPVTHSTLCNILYMRCMPITFPEYHAMPCQILAHSANQMGYHRKVVSLCRCEWRMYVAITSVWNDSGKNTEHDQRPVGKQQFGVDDEN